MLGGIDLHSLAVAVKRALSQGYAYATKGDIVIGTGTGTAKIKPAPTSKGYARLTDPTQEDGWVDKAAPADGYIRMADAAQADGWRDVPAAFATGSGKRIAARSNAVTPVSKIDITADELIVRNAAGLAKRLDTVSVTIDIAVAGANGLDTGAEAASTWYYGWVVAKDDGTVAGLLSTSSSAPTLPAGYTFKALVSAVRNDGSSNFIAYRQFGNEITYEARWPVLTNGAATVETAVSTASFVPPPATSAALLVSNRVVASASGATSSSAEIRYVSGANFFLLTSWANTSTTNFNDATVRMPNVVQNIYYSNGPAGAAATNTDLTVYVLGFTLPGGGE